MELSQIDKYEYERLLESGIHSKQEMYRLASYPYVSLLSQYKNLSVYENKKIREIEDDNISTFLRLVSLIFGIGDQDEVNTVRRLMNEEPLRSAVIAARQEIDPSDREPRFFELASKILLSVDKKGTSFLNAINIRINGKIPSWPFSDRQDIADNWFRNFVDIKLNGMKVVYKGLGAEMAYTFIVSSTLYSLYFFAPSRYYISACRSDDEALHEVLRVFTNLKNKRI